MPGSGAGSPSPARLLSATLLFALLYVVAVPGLFLLIMTVFAWKLLHWLLLSVMLVPFLLGMGLLGLAKGLVPVGLLIGAVAARTPMLLWPKLLAAAALPIVDLLLLRHALPFRLLERGSLALMDHRALFLLDTAAPLAASVAAALLVPQAVLRRVLGLSPRSRELALAA